MEIVLGDILQWISTTATVLNIDLDEVSMMNIRKNYLLHKKELEEEHE